MKTRHGLWVTSVLATRPSSNPNATEAASGPSTAGGIADENEGRNSGRADPVECGSRGARGWGKSHLEVDQEAAGQVGRGIALRTEAPRSLLVSLHECIGRTATVTSRAGRAVTLGVSQVRLRTWTQGSSEL